MGIRERYEQHHKVTITDEAVKAAADLSIRYITDRHLPGQGDRPHRRGRAAASACATRPRRPRCARRRRSSTASRRRRTRRSTTRSTRRRPACARPRRPPARRVDGSASEWQSQVAGDQPTVDEEEIAQVVAMWTGIPVTRIAAGGVGAAAPHGGRPPQPGHRPAGGDRDRLEGRPPRARRPEGSRSARSARSSSSAPRASGRRSSPRPSPSSCSAARTRSSRST